MKMIYDNLGICKNEVKVVSSSGVRSTVTPYIILASTD